MSCTTRYSSRRSLKSQNHSQSKVLANIPHQIKQCEQFIKLRSGSVEVNKLEHKKSQIKDSTLQKKGVSYQTGRKSLIQYERQKSVEKQKEKPEMIFTNCVFEGQQENSQEKYIQQIVKYLYRGKTGKEQYSQWEESQEETNGKRERVYKQKLRRRLIKSNRMEKEYKIKRNGDEKETGKKTKILDKDYQIKMRCEKAKDKQIIKPRHKKLRSFAQNIERIIHFCCSNVNQDADRDNIQDFVTIKTIQFIVNQVLKRITHKRQTEDKQQVGETVEWSTSKQPIGRYYKYLRQQHLALFIKLVQIDLQPEYSKKSKQIFEQNKNYIITNIQANKHTHKIKKIRQGHELQVATEKQKHNQIGILRSEIETQKMDSQSFLLDVLGNFQFARFGNQDWMQELEQ